MKNVVEMRRELGAVFYGLKDGSLKPSIAKEMNNACGKMIHGAKAQLERAVINKSTAECRWLDDADPA